MKKKFTFFNLLIALSFILLLLIAIQIIGGYFIRELEATTISDFKNMDSQVVQLSNTLSTQMSNKDLERSDVDANLKALSDFSNADISEARIVDDKGIIRATNDLNQQNIIGKKNDYRDLNDFTSKKYQALIMINACM